MELYYADGTPKKWWGGVLEPAFPGLHGDDDYSDILPALAERGILRVDELEGAPSYTPGGHKLPPKRYKKAKLRRKLIVQATPKKQVDGLFTEQQDATYVWIVVNDLIKQGATCLYWMGNAEVLSACRFLRRFYKNTEPLKYRAVVRTIEKMYMYKG